MRTIHHAAGSAALLALLSLAPGCLFALTRDPAEVALGAPAPSATALTDPAGRPFSLDSLASKGRPVIVFYRGHW
jgi:cytochrome oxidase Cu insertion factor (SCO1/SenC/PrrC family)